VNDKDDSRSLTASEFRDHKSSRNSVENRIPNTDFIRSDVRDISVGSNSNYERVSFMDKAKARNVSGSNDDDGDADGDVNLTDNDSNYDETGETHERRPTKHIGRIALGIHHHPSKLVNPDRPYCHAFDVDEVLGGLPSKQYTQGSRVDQHHYC
jgi:hypothetical protein